jgi:hypothetical protein
MSFLSSVFGSGANSQAYNPVNAQQVSLAGGPTGQQDLNNQNQLYAQQQNFANTLQQQANGQGPSVANLQLQQTLQQQQANAAAQAASARGVSPALANRQAQQAQASNSQASAQSGALARAQETLNAQGELGSTLNNQASQNISQQGLGLQAQEANQQANLGAQEATSQIGQAQNAGQFNILSGLAQGVAGLAGMGGGGAGHAFGGQIHGYANGGKVMNFDGGGSVPPYTGGYVTPDTLSALNNASRMLGGSNNAGVGASSSPSTAFQTGRQLNKTLTANPPPAAGDTQASGPGGMFSVGGKVKAMLSPGEVRVPVDKTKNPKEAERYAAQAVKNGKKIPGKAKVAGDSLQNDTVPANLNEGDIIVKRSKAKDPQDAAAFVRALLASQRGGK